jgi:hypothetical protein
MNVEIGNYYIGIKQEEIIESRELNLIRIFNLIPKLDGNKWCVVLGDIIEGVAGFGDSPYQACLDFNKNFYKKHEEQPCS